ncbi:golgin subfamily A member 6-like protein 22 [Ooceraea biroi]|uniref:golgin subfamily A member 6-like protein 22 n=1 Tax=Ooceraea biroi TaxID=2015173 RepID=UPI000F0842FB|nr:golgin subfamily A member 6-like protein 22 [Ooceraea biroi]
MVYKRIGKRKRKKLGYKDWWDKECTRKKREIIRRYRKWKKGTGRREDFINSKRELQELLVKKKAEKREKEMQQLKGLRNEKEIWDFINKRRTKREWINNEIHKEEWRKYFMELLDGHEKHTAEEEEHQKRDGSQQEESEDRKVRTEEEIRIEKEELQELESEEIWRAVRKLKKGKASGIDGIQMEAWKYGGVTSGEVRTLLTWFLC